MSKMGFTHGQLQIESETYSFSIMYSNISYPSSTEFYFSGNRICHGSAAGIAVTEAGKGHIVG